MALFLRLDDRRRVDARARAERVGAEDRIVHRDRHADRLGGRVAVLGQLGQVPPSPVGAEQPQVHDQEIHLGITYALPHPQRCGVHAVHAGLDRGEAVDQPHAAVAVPVPVDPHVFLPYDV